MPPTPHSSDAVSIPALLVERAIDLARAEAGLALVHTRRIAIRAVSALLGTIVACAFVQLALVLLVAWPVLAGHVPSVNLVVGVIVSLVFGSAGAAFAVSSWAGAMRERQGNNSAREASAEVAVAERAMPPSGGEPRDTPDEPRAANLPERASL